MAARNSIRTVGIIGSGPSGATLASLLTMKGVEVTLFDDGRRPELIVGESLIPAVVPVLRRLGLEERAAAICQLKPGVTFTFGEAEKVEFCFQSLAHFGGPTYAYNSPRPAFDRLFDERADELGVKRVRARANIERVGSNSLQLAGETLAQAPWLRGRQPDLLVDSTGRSRFFARTLEIPAEVGPRKDVAYFAHYEGFIEQPPRGQVIIGRLASGWCWRIPLRDRLSVGVVMNKDDAAKLGASPAERLEAAIDRDPLLAAAGKNRRRLTEIATYTNYQLVAECGHGPNWVMTGDAFGFVDPMLSPGMHLALYSAELLSEHLEDLPAYSREVRKQLKAWMELIQYFYDGRIFAMYQTGMAFERTFPGRVTGSLHRFFDREVARMASGLDPTSRFGHGMLQLMSYPAAWKTDPATLAIR
ncbi:MAG TPA: tryptophan 7-halogenase [Candidatus Acidoferrales bacterium]|nr:tryptophan 7-halogenase [Candidatus Acidoferrales bacterium]